MAAGEGPQGLGAGVAGYPGRGLHGVIVEKIGVRIVRGQYAAGDLLHADNLEQEFQASKTAVREALKVLTAKGLLDSRQRRGTFVLARSSWNLVDPDLLRWLRHEPTPEFLENLAEVRLIVEPAAVRLAARRRTDADLVALEDAVCAMAAAADSQAADQPAGLVDAEVRFHRALLAAAHNELLGRLDVVSEAGLRARPGARADRLAVHQAVLDAVHARDEHAAVTAIRRLLSDTAPVVAAVQG